MACAQAGALGGWRAHRTCALCHDQTQQVRRCVSRGNPKPLHQLADIVGSTVSLMLSPNLRASIRTKEETILTDSTQDSGRFSTEPTGAVVTRGGRGRRALCLRAIWLLGVPERGQWEGCLSRGLQGFTKHVCGEQSKPRKLCWAGRIPHINSGLKKRKGTLHGEQTFDGEGHETPNLTWWMALSPLRPHLMQRQVLEAPSSGRVGEAKANKAAIPGPLWKQAAGVAVSSSLRMSPPPPLHSALSSAPSSPLFSLRLVFSLFVFFFKTPPSLPTKQKVMCRNTLSQFCCKLSYGGGPRVVLTRRPSLPPRALSPVLQVCTDLPSWLQS